MFPFVVDVEMSPRPLSLSHSLQSTSTSSFYSIHNSEACNRNLKEENKIETKQTHTHTQKPKWVIIADDFQRRYQKQKQKQETKQSKAPKEMQIL